MSVHQSGATIPGSGLAAGAEQRRPSPSAIIFASNRGPVEYRMGAGGELQARRGSGGVVTALSAAAASVAGSIPVTWVAAAMTEGDRLAMSFQAASEPFARGAGLATHFVSSEPESYHLYYNVFCNPVLWFLQHGLWGALSPSRSADEVEIAWRRGYVPLNERFGAAIVRAAASQARPAILLQDYHLYLAAAYVRARLPKARIAQFIHVPWPEPRQWSLLPDDCRRAIYAAVCANDLIGFQTAADVGRFLAGCETFLAGAQVDRTDGCVRWQGRETHARSYPISIDCEGLRQRAAAAELRALVARLRPLCGEKTIVRVDRLDPSKNIVRGFQALHVLLEGWPELQGRLRFLAFLVPSRTDIPEYRSYLAEVMAAAQSVNTRFGRANWEPVQVFYEENCDQAVAAMTLYDVLLVNPVADGMNLVAKEGPTVNERNGALVLSERAGAYEQLKVGALIVDPHDVADTAHALAEALAMPEAERARRLRLLRAAIADYDIADWLSDQVRDLMAIGRPAAALERTAGEAVVPQERAASAALVA